MQSNKPFSLQLFRNWNLSIMSSLKSCVKLCTFDVTNTLLKFKISVGDQYVKIGRIYGVERDPVKITSAFGHHWKMMNLHYPNFGCNAGLTSQEWWNKIVHSTFLSHGESISDKQLNRISNHLYEIYKNNVCWEVVPGVVPLLKYLKEKNILLGVISNFDERLESVLCANDLDNYFNFILASYTVQVAKPDKKIFDLALSKCPKVLSSDALHVGDDFKLDYLAAKSAGWNSILICDNIKEATSLYEVENQNEIFEDITKVKAYIFP